VREILPDGVVAAGDPGGVLVGCGGVLAPG
jgi:hypothetical protein